MEEGNKYILFWEAEYINLVGNSLNSENNNFT